MASPIQFSVRQLLIAVAFVAVGIAALRNANSYWMSGLWGVVPLILAVAILLVIFRRDSSQTFWIGFALFGWLYFGIVLVAYWPTPNSSRYDALTFHQLWSTKLIDWTYAKIIPEPQRNSQIPVPAAQGGGPGGMSSGFGGATGTFGAGMGGMGSPSGFGFATIPNPDYVDLMTFQQIGHALWLVILAALGGKLAQWIYRTGVRRQDSGGSGP